jgi:hypothetical protein
MFLNERMRLKAKAIPSIESILSRLLQALLKQGCMAGAQAYWIKVWRHIKIRGDSISLIA